MLVNKNQLDQGTRGKRVGIVLQPTRMYCRRVVRGIVAFGAEAGWEWLLVPSEAVPALTNTSNTAIDGFIGYFADDSATAELLASALPVVDISVGAGSVVTRVTSDDAAVGRVAATYLLSLGTTHYGYFGWRGRGDSDARGGGFARTIEAAGFTCRTFLWPAEGRESESPDEPNGELASWVASLPKPVGILASNDRRAVQLLAVCHRLGLNVPDTVAVVGVDNDDVFCELANPPLSSVALSTQEIGYEAAQMLERLMRGEKPKQNTLLIPPAGVVPRSSSGLKAIVDSDVAAAVRYIALHVKDHLQVADVLREINVSRRSLDMRFMQVLGRTAAQEIRRAQVSIAKQALVETEEPMERVAAMAGFASAKQMGATFHAATGSTLTAYRREHLFTIRSLKKRSRS